MRRPFLFFAIMFLLVSTSAFSQTKEPLRFALRTNLISWVPLFAPNIGAEIYMGDRWSAGVDGSYGWWGFRGTQNAIQNWSVAADAAYWLRPGGFLGERVGFSARTGQFDSKWGTWGRRGHFAFIGPTFGGRWRLGTAANWFFDAGIGVGYVYADYDKYEWYGATRCFVRVGHKTHHVFGLTHVNTSLIYRFSFK